MPLHASASAALPTRRQLIAGAALSTVAWTLAGCRAEHLNTSQYTPPPLDVSGPRSLKSSAAQHGMLAGFALDAGLLRDSEMYQRIVREQCSIAVCETEMKWAALRPSADRYDFAAADSVLEFTSAARIKLRGHTLCWHEALPPWFESGVTSGNARSMLTEHIHTVAGRYAGRLHSWDVVNEAVHVADGRPDGLRKTPWMRLIGDGYIETAFRVAREADPTALLTYNDFGIEGETGDEQQKRAAVLVLLRRLRQRNVPLDAVGIQSHIKGRSMFGYGPALQKFIQSCRELDLQVFLTEMDVNDQELPSAPESRDAGVAKSYQDYLRTVLTEPNLHAVLTWGVHDRQSWLNGRFPRRDGEPQRPLLLDANFRPKAAFAAVTSSFAVHGVDSA